MNTQSDLVNIGNVTMVKVIEKEENQEIKKSSGVWWSKRWGKDKLCGITHTRLRQGTDCCGLSYVVYLKCGHGFYRTPICNWVYNCRKNYKEPTCPICRKKIL